MSRERGVFIHYKFPRLKECITYELVYTDELTLEKYKSKVGSLYCSGGHWSLVKNLRGQITLASLKPEEVPREFRAHALLLL